MDLARLRQENYIVESVELRLLSQRVKVEAGPRADHDPLDLLAGVDVAQFLAQQLGGAEVDVLALAFADGADVDEQHGGGVETVLAAQRGLFVCGGEGVDPRRVHPARQEAEIVPVVEIVEHGAR